MTSGPDEDRLLADVTAEILRKEPEPMHCAFAPATVIMLAGLIQLALRHPGNHGTPTAATGERFLELARAYFADAPAVLRMLALGDDPAHDRDWRRP